MTDEEYKLAEEIILPIFRKVIRNDDSLAKYGINCYYAGLKAGKDMAEADLATVAYMQGATQQKKKSEKQLIKAKEIIKALLKHTHGQNLNTQNDFDLYLGRIKEAEQFLKETENGK